MDRPILHSLVEACVRNTALGPLQGRSGMQRTKRVHALREDTLELCQPIQDCGKPPQVLSSPGSLPWSAIQ